MVERKANTAKRKPKGDITFQIPLDEEQKLAKSEILTRAYSFIIGRQGTGKTLLACQVALDLLFKRQVDRIIITRPTVGTEDNGFLPGTLKEKMEPWMVPIRSNMMKVYPHKDKLEKLEEEGELQILSIAHFRGQTFDKAVVIVDEFQNLTKSQLKMALGRLGKDSIMLLCGDESQVDLRKDSESAIHVVKNIPISEYTYKITLTQNHRHEAVDYIMQFIT